MKNSNSFIKFLILVIIPISSCSSDDSVKEEKEENKPVKEIVLATLKTNEAEEVDVFRATIFGEIIDNGGASVTEHGVCYGVIENPTYDGTKKNSSSIKGSGEFKVNLGDLVAESVYYARAYGVNAKGVNYGNQISFITLSPVYPLLKVGEIKVAGAHDIFIDVELEEGDLDITELGIVYGTSVTPTIEGNKIIRDNIGQSFKQRISNLIPETLYYIRPYVKTSQGILYGEEISLQTIKKGDFTYSFNQNGADAATVARIKTAFDIATTYYNNFTSIVKHVTVNYSPDTPTADANFDGWIRVGANSGYQKAGTAMHEMAHTVGVGTHWKYFDDLMKTSPWKGNRANEIIQMMTDDPSAVVKGDKVHFWPYGINGAHEDDGTDFLYMMNALILQGMKEDGLPSN